MPKQPIYKFKYKNYFNNGLTLKSNKGDYSFYFDKQLGLRGQFIPKGRALGQTIDMKLKRK